MQQKRETTLGAASRVYSHFRAARKPLGAKIASALQSEIENRWQLDGRDDREVELPCFPAQLQYGFVLRDERVRTGTVRERKKWLVIPVAAPGEARRQ